MDSINYREVLEQSSAYLVLINPDLSVLSVSDGFLGVTENTRRDIIGRSVYQIFSDVENNLDEIFLEKIKESLNKVSEGKTTETTPVLRYNISGNNKSNGYEVRYWKVINTPILDNSDEIKYIKQIYIDVTESDDIASQLMIEKEEDNEFKSAAKFLQRTFKQAPAPICVLRGPGHIFELANKEFLRIFTNNDIIGKPAREAIPEIRGQGFFEILDEVYETEKTYTGGEIKISLNPGKKNGPEIYVDFVYQIIYDTKGNKAGVFALGSDVTEQVKARKQAEEDEFRFRKLIEESPVATAVYVKPNNIVKYANDKMLAYWNKDISILGVPLYDAVPELKKHPFISDIADVYDTGETKSGFEEETVLNEDGKERIYYFNYTYKALHKKNGEVYGVHNVVEDVTEQVIARKKVEESEFKYRTLIEQLPVPTAIFKGPDMIVEYVNDKLLEIWDKDKTVFGKPLRDVQPELKKQPFLDYLDHVYTSGETWSGNEEKAELMRDGKLQTFYFDFTYKALHYKDGGMYGIHCVAIDVTRRIEARKELEKREKSLRSLLNSMPQKISHADSEGNVLFYNQQWIDETGFNEEELKGSGWVEAVHPDDLDFVKESWVNAVKNGVEFNIEARFLHKDDGYRWNVCKAIPVKNEKNEIMMWVGTNTDIHDQKKQKEILEKAVKERTRDLEKLNKELFNRNEEIEKHKEELLAANKELESFAYISSHDLQEPLRKIQLFADRIVEKESQNLTERGKNYFKRMEDSADRMQILIEDLLSFSRVNNADTVFEKVNLSRIINEEKEEFSNLIKKKNATIETPAKCEVNVILFQFRQLMKNLISNALKFTNPDVQPHIIVKCSIHKGSELDHEKLIPDKNYCKIIVKDNGIGFEPEYSDRIFEVFKRLHSKDEHPGTGIGLAIVKKIVENHNGFISATGKPNEGATFEIIIPVEQ